MAMGVTTMASAMPSKPLVAARLKRIVSVGGGDEGNSMRKSLDRDVRLHPDDFVVFVTDVGAHRFVAEHADDVQRETNERITARGVVGYWQGKTLVVLPLELEKSSQ
jgi:hypothetical protein